MYSEIFGDMKIKDLVRHKELRWIGQVKEIEKLYPCWNLINLQLGFFPWKPYYLVNVVLEEDGVLFCDDLEKWELI